MFPPLALIPPAMPRKMRGIPDETIIALLALWQVHEPRSVWVAVDDALGEILTAVAIEDDQ